MEREFNASATLVRGCLFFSYFSVQALKKARDECKAGADARMKLAIRVERLEEM